MERISSHEARKALDISVIVPSSTRDILDDALNQLREYERKFNKLEIIKEANEKERDADTRCDQMAMPYQLVRDTEINLIEQILDKEF